MYEELNAVYKPHWTLRSTKARRKAKVTCVFDKVCNVMIAIYALGMFAWIFFDAFH